MSIATDSAALAGLSVFDLIADVPGHLLRLKLTMVTISHGLAAAAARSAMPGHVFAGFQYLSLYQKAAPYYERLAAAGHHTWVFGVPDVAVAPLPNMTVVPLLPDAALAQEWFVIVDGPAFGAARPLTPPPHSGIPPARRAEKPRRGAAVFVWCTAGPQPLPNVLHSDGFTRGRSQQWIGGSSYSSA